ncbi:MAG: DUF58 domain-containing protein [Pseudomonadales bacterium]|nr:DUF58 domain-containing protein [Pseudomonadales bacterium]
MEPKFQPFSDRYSGKLKRIYRNWLDRRLPKSTEITLSQRRIFILPNRPGLLFSGLLLLLFLMAINYQNSMVFAYTFMLASLFPVIIIFTYRNLSGLGIRVAECSSVFAGEAAKITLDIYRTDHRIRQQLQFRWNESSHTTANLLENDQDQIELYVPAEQRGYLNPGRLNLQSTYPLGLVRSWSWLRFELYGLVYPKPIEGELPVQAAPGQEPNLRKIRVAMDEISGLRRYVLGDSPKQVAWKSYAATGEMNVKQFEGSESEKLWLDFNEVRGGHLEYRLSVLCYWILKLEADNCLYGLRLGEQAYEPASGIPHRDLLLSALATFDLDKEHSVSR